MKKKIIGLIVLLLVSAFVLGLVACSVLDQAEEPTNEESVEDTPQEEQEVSPDPTPDPAPDPEPTPTPDPTPDPEPTPTPDPAPDPEPTPTPTPDPEPPVEPEEPPVELLEGYLRVNAAGEESVIGAYVLFGNYPQSRVTDEATVSALTEKAGDLPTADSQAWTSYKYYVEGSNATDYMWYIDLPHDGSLYRGVYFAAFRPDDPSAASFSMDNRQIEHGLTTNTVYWFRYDPIKWRILAEEGREALILCDSILDSQSFDYDGSYSNDYKESTIRAWLNGVFYETAFSELQREIILLTEVDGYGQETTDHVTLLSLSEASNGAYGFNSIYNDTARQKSPTDYAKSQGALLRDGYGYWWLRTAFDYDDSIVATVWPSGMLLSSSAFNASYGVVPALRIRLTNAVEEPIDEEAVELLEGYLRVNAAGEESADGEYVLFGNYPQSEVTDEVFKKALSVAVGALPTWANRQAWTSYNYSSYDSMWYIDLEYAGGKYRGVYFTSYREYSAYPNGAYPYTYQDDNGYQPYTIYWFRYEPVKWRILAEEGAEAMIVCESIIDSQDYYHDRNDSVFAHNGGIGYANNYALSDIRAWLNGVFYETAFSELQREIILLTTVDNSARSTNPSYKDKDWDDRYACEDTEDYVFLLSELDVTMGSYGVNGEKNATGYARVQGLDPNPYADAPYWWLRSPFNMNMNCACFGYREGLADYEDFVDRTSAGVVPALRIWLGDPAEIPEEPIIPEQHYARVDELGVESASGEYILFGSYPQSVVTDESIKAALTAAVGTLPIAGDRRNWTSYEYYIEGSNETDFMWYIDVPHDGNLYRGVYFTSYRPYYTEGSSSAGNSRQSSNGYETGSVYWFRYDPIRWKILSEGEGEALLLSELVLDAQEYYPAEEDLGAFYHNGATGYANNYALSNIRKWLNSTFYDTAFSALEKRLVLSTLVDNSDKSTGAEGNPYVCEDTEDAVFLLSFEDIWSEQYGLTEHSNRLRRSTDYAKAQGSMESGGTDLWLRSPTPYYASHAWYLYGDGTTTVFRVDAVDGILPVLRIRLGNTMEDPIDEEAVELLEGYLRVNAAGEEAEDGAYILFGNYPQSEVTDEVFKNALNAAAGILPTAENSRRWTSYEYYYVYYLEGCNDTDFMWYIDLEYAGGKYRGVYFNSYRPFGPTGSRDSYQDDNGYTAGSVYWFRYEPIEWRIMSEEGGEALILCEMLIDSQDFYPSNSDSSFDHNGGRGFANNYALSNIRIWLNGFFYETAFSDLQQELILLTTVDNSARSINPNDNATYWNGGFGVDQYACEDTEDHVFLLSMQEVTNTAYGFSSDCRAYDAARQKIATDYARVQGIDPSSYADAPYWLLRSPCVDEIYDGAGVSALFKDGDLRESSVSMTSYGVAPALRIRLGDAPEIPAEPVEEEPVDLLEGYLRVNAAGEETEDGDYILFGNYPQSEVTDETIISELFSLSGISSPDDVSYGWSMDLVYDRAKYRGKRNRNNGISWYKYEPIMWRIMSEEGGDYLILAEMILDGGGFYSEYTELAIEHNGGTGYVSNYALSDLRIWLNDAFCEAAFSEHQQESILLTLIDNSPASTGSPTNPYACDDTEDRLFLLSYAEVMNDYGLNDSTWRFKQCTDYAQAQGAYMYHGNGVWWLRSPSTDYQGPTCALYMDYNGYVGEYMGYVSSCANYIPRGIVPALRIRLGDAPEIPEEPVEEEPVDLLEGYLRVDAAGEETEDGDYILFGSYPQSEVRDEEIKNALNSAAGELPTAENSQAWTSYGYYIEGSNETDFMWYIDLEYAGEKYRGVYFTSYRPQMVTGSVDEYSEVNAVFGYCVGSVYWFRYDPITWCVLAEREGVALLSSHLMLTTGEFDLTSNQYAESSVRAWLNEVFYREAFSAAAKREILSTALEGDVTDQVFLLSCDEVENGLRPLIDLEQDPIGMSDYAGIQGYAYGCWWLRTPDAGYADLEQYISGVGWLYSRDVREAMIGIVPAIFLML